MIQNMVCQTLLFLSINALAHGAKADNLTQTIDAALTIPLAR